MYSKFGAYQRWCRTTSARAQFYQRPLEMVYLINDPDCPRAGRHRELEKAEIKKSEDAVQRVLTAVRNFTNPFTITDKDRLYSLASGAPTLRDVEKDVLQAETVGKAEKKAFIERLHTEESDGFFGPIKRKRLKTIEASNKKSSPHILRGKGRYLYVLAFMRIGLTYFYNLLSSAIFEILFWHHSRSSNIKNRVTSHSCSLSSHKLKKNHWS